MSLFKITFQKYQYLNGSIFLISHPLYIGGGGAELELHLRLGQPHLFLKKKYLFIYGCVGSVSVRGLSLVAASGGHSSSRCAGLSLSRPLSLRSTGSRRAGSVVVAHRPSCSAACGIFPDRGSNPCPLHWQADSQPLRHQGSPSLTFFAFTAQFTYLDSLKRTLFKYH